MEIEKAFKRLLIKSPFYGLFCLGLPKNITRSIQTLSVSKEGVNCQLNINPDFWEQHSDDQQIALLMHELGHICFQHMFLQESFSDHKLFNIAADMEVNSYIENLPEDACTAELLGKQLGVHVEKGQGTKYYYELISKQGNQSSSSSEAQSSQDQTGSSSGNSNSQEESKDELEKEEKQYPEQFNDTFKPIDSHDNWKSFNGLPDATKQLISNNINAALKRTAEQVEKSCGTIPGELVEIIDMLRKKKPQVFNWKAYFRRMLGSIYDINIRSTRRKESKRFEGSAGIQHRKKVSILVAIDTSGSVSKNELKDFFSEIDYIHKAGARITLLECDTQINSITEYDGKTLPKIHGRGGKMKICASLCSNT